MKKQKKLLRGIVLSVLLVFMTAAPLPVRAENYSQAVVLEVQQKLTDYGIDCGTPDGKAGAKTKEAVRQWQKKAGEDADGVIDEDLLLEMGVSDDGNGVGSDSILEDIPQYSGEPYVTLDDNVPSFKSADLTTKEFETYASLDSLGRCGTAYADVSEETMPTQKRGKIGSVKPTAWHAVKYDGIDGNYLYNRCHLIGYQLAGENANKKNLITGTRYLNTEGMLPFENMVADYVKETGNHVLYRVTPVYDGDNLLASGVEMEAESVEDKGEGILFHVFCYNVQPGVAINYSDGNSFSAPYTGSTFVSTNSASEGSESAPAESSSEQSGQAKSSRQQDKGTDVMVWVSATGSKYHSIPNCGRMNPDKAHQETESQAIASGLEKCKKCW